MDVKLLRKHLPGPDATCPGLTRRGGWAILALALAGCSVQPAAVKEAPVVPVRADESVPAVLLAYHQQLLRLSSQELAKERSLLIAQPSSPAGQVRLAMIYGQPRGGGDLGRALALLEAVLKSSEPAAVSLHPLARLLADQYMERQRNDTQMEKLNQQIKDNLRRADQLQEKLDALADIERSLPTRPRATRPAPAGAQR